MSGKSDVDAVEISGEKESRWVAAVWTLWSKKVLQLVAE
jgi:hypothetical protein